MKSARRISGLLLHNRSRPFKTPYQQAFQQEFRTRKEALKTAPSARVPDYSSTQDLRQHVNVVIELLIGEAQLGNGAAGV